MSPAMGVGTNLPLNFLGQGKLTIVCCPLGMEGRKMVCLSRVCVCVSSVPAVAQRVHQLCIVLWRHANFSNGMLQLVPGELVHYEFFDLH